MADSSDDRIRRAIRVYDAATHAAVMDRRALLSDMARIAGSAAAGAALLSGIEARAAAPPHVGANDTRLAAGRVQWTGAGGRAMSGYAAMPRSARGAMATILVIHENRGLNAHVEDVTRRAALVGFRAIAPDFLSPAGGTPPPGADPAAAEDRARSLIAALNPARTVADAVATVAAFAGADVPTGEVRGNGRVGIMGFCWGGGLVSQVALAAPPALREAVSWYGPLPAATARVAEIKARLTFHFAGRDTRVNAGWPPYEAALKAAHIPYEAWFYPDAEHAFNNDTSAERYNAAAAALAWQRSMEALGRLRQA